MGFLTNPSPSQGKLSMILTKHHGKLSTLLYFGGIFWFGLLAHKYWNAATYFSENALLSGLVKNDFEDHTFGQNVFKELEYESSLRPNAIPYSWISAKFRQMNLDTYFHNFTLDYPFRANTSYTGQNVYAIVRASRASSVEGLVVSAPFRTKDSIHSNNNAAIALMLSLANFCRKQKYWAKDIIFLITEHEQLGMQAWLEAYHGVQSGNGILHHGDIIGRAGALQAAINLEFHGMRIKHLDVKIEGLNGQLPNLDLVNLVRKLSDKEGIKHTIKNRTEARKRGTPYQQWSYALGSLLTMVVSQATGTPTGNHGLFHRFGIQALTIEGAASSDGAAVYWVGRVLEGMLRSLNNLLERFHQSYFFYLLPSTDRYISIGIYMPAVCLIGAPLLLKALYLWLNTQSSKGSATAFTESLNLNMVSLVLLFSHLTGIIFVKSPVYITSILSDTGLTTEASVYLGYMTLQLVSIAVSFLFRLQSPFDVEVVNVVALLELATLLLSVAMNNFSLAFLLAIIYVPVVLLTKSTKSLTRRLVQYMFLFLLHPLTLLHVAVVCYTWYSYQDEQFYHIVFRSLDAVRRAILISILDNMVYGAWISDVLFGFFTANWGLFWIISHS